MHHIFLNVILSTIIESICGTNGCDAGETILGMTLIIAAVVVGVIVLVVFFQ
jgi:hypothetical protein